MKAHRSVLQRSHPGGEISLQVEFLQDGDCDLQAVVVLEVVHQVDAAVTADLSSPSNIRHSVVEDQAESLGLGESQISVNTPEEVIADFFRLTILIWRGHGFSSWIKHIFVKLCPSFADVEEFQGLRLFKIKEEVKFCPDSADPLGCPVNAATAPGDNNAGNNNNTFFISNRKRQLTINGSQRKPSMTSHHKPSSNHCTECSELRRERQIPEPQD